LRLRAGMMFSSRAKLREGGFLETLWLTKDYLSGKIALKGIAVISIPVFTRILTTEDYGVLNVFNSYVQLASVILPLSAHTAVSRYYYENKEDFGEFLGTTILFMLILFGSSAVLCLTFSKPISRFIELPETLVACALAICLMKITWGLYSQLLIPRKRSKEFSFLSVFQGYSGFALSVLLVLLLTKDRYMGCIAGRIVVGTCFSIYFIRLLWQETSLCLYAKHLKYICNYSLPLVLYHLSSVVLGSFDRIMINKMIDTSSAGLYSLGYNVGMFLLLTIGSIQSALVPNYFSLQQRGEYDRLDVLFGRLFAVIVIVAAGLILFAQEIVSLLAAKEFQEGLRVVPIVVIGYVFYAMFMVYGMYPGYVKKTYYTTIVVTIAGGANIGLNAIFLPRYGYLAAAYTTVASYFIMSFLAYVAAKWFLRVRVAPLRVVVRPTLLLFLVTATEMYLGTMNLHASTFFLARVAGMIVLAAVLFGPEIRKRIGARS